MTWIEIVLTALAGVSAGALSALMGVGGGTIVIPFMLLVLGTGQHVAEGTSLLVMVPTSLAGAWAHSRQGFVRWRAAGYLAAAGVASAIAGALVAIQLDGHLLRRIYAVFALVVAYRFLKPSDKAKTEGVG